MDCCGNSRHTSFLFLSIFGFVFVVVGFAAGYTDRGLGFSAAVTFLIYTIFFALLALPLALATKFGLFLLLLFIGIPVLLCDWTSSDFTHSECTRIQGRASNSGLTPFSPWTGKTGR